MAPARKSTAKSKAKAKKRATTKDVDPKIFTTPLFNLTLKELADTGLLNEKSKKIGKAALQVQLSAADVQRIAEALAKLSKK